MAIYSFNYSAVSRSTGANACATLAYISGEKIKCNRTEETFKYGHKDRIVSVKTFLPEGTKEKYYNPSELINRIEDVEKNKNAITAKKIIVALPCELSKEERETVLYDFVKNEITNRNFACVIAIHDDPEDKNPHAHILIPNRPFEKGDFAKQKRKSEYALDENGNKIPILDENGKQKIGDRNRKMWLRVYSNGRNALDQKETLESMRETWEKSCNKFLKKENQIDHRSFKDRGISTEPTIHEGYAARKIEKDGGISEKCEYNRAIKVIREMGDKSIKEELKRDRSEYNALLKERENIEKEEVKAKAEKAKEKEVRAAHQQVTIKIEPVKQEPKKQEIKPEIVKEWEPVGSRPVPTIEPAPPDKKEQASAAKVAPPAPTLWLEDEKMQKIAKNWEKDKTNNYDLFAMEKVVIAEFPAIKSRQISDSDLDRLCEAAYVINFGSPRWRNAKIKKLETARRVFSDIIEAAAPVREPERQPEPEPEQQKERQKEPEIRKVIKKEKNRGMER